MILPLLFSLALAVLLDSTFVPGPISGSVVPLPQSIEYLSVNLTLRKDELKLVSNLECDVIEQGIVRYKRLIFCDDAEGTGGPSLGLVTVRIEGKCEAYPYFGMDEKYSLDVNPNGTATLRARTVWGAVRGLETLSQLVFTPVDKPRTLMIRTARVVDWPRFAHRGLLVDTSRHFLPVASLLETIELMGESKLNVLHWHIVDDQSFPYTSKVYPDMASGAYSAEHVYSRADIADVVERGRVRGIRVVVEFDTPGHTTSWGHSQPQLLTQCFSNISVPTGEHHLLDPTQTSTWDFLLSFFSEVLQTFPDEYIHLGGDEVSYQFPCWLNNPHVKQFMQLYSWEDATQIEQYYFQNLLTLVERARIGTSYIVWQEVLDNKIKVKDNTIAHVWKGNNRFERAEELLKITSGGYRTLLSSCWYLNYIKYGEDWKEQYTCDPQDFNGTTAQKNLVIGGEACIWGEWVDPTNLTPRLWPRASAIAERLWSGIHVRDLEDAAQRLHEHHCRMIRRGFPAEPIAMYTFCPKPYITKSPVY